MSLLLLGVGGALNTGTDPHTWANRLLEIRLDDPANVYKSLGPNVPVSADGDSIIAVQDIGSDGTRSPLQLTSGNRATWKTGITPTGKAVMRFDGIDDKYTLAASIAAAEFQTFTAISVSFPTASTTSTLFSSATTTGACQDRINNLGKQELLKNAIVSIGTATNAIAGSAFNVQAVKYNDPTWTHYQSKVANGTGSNSQTFTSVTDGLGQSNGLELFSGDLAYLVICSDLKTDVEIASAMQYLMTYWGAV